MHSAATVAGTAMAAKEGIVIETIILVQLVRLVQLVQTKQTNKTN